MSRFASDIVKELVRTEKGAIASVQRKYFFSVDVRATKPEIRRAVEELFSVKVDRVNTAIVSGKPRRMGRRWGWKADRKRAVVTLAEGNKIEVAT